MLGSGHWALGTLLQRLVKNLEDLQFVPSGDLMIRRHFPPPEKLVFLNMSESDSFALGEDLVQSPTHQTASTTTYDFDGLLESPLVLHQDLRNGNGGQVWPAGMILASYLLRRKRDELRQASMFVHTAPFGSSASANG